MNCGADKLNSKALEISSALLLSRNDEIGYVGKQFERE